LISSTLQVQILEEQMHPVNQMTRAINGQHGPHMTLHARFT